MNDTILRSTTEEGTTGVKGTGTPNAIRREAIFAKKSVGMQLEITRRGRIGKLENGRNPPGNLHITDWKCNPRRVK